MSILLKRRPKVQPEPAPIDEAELEYLESAVRFGFAGDCPAAEPAFGALDLVDAEIAYHRGRSSQDGDTHDLVVTDLIDLRLVWRHYPGLAPRALVALGGTIFAGLDIAGLDEPEARTSDAAAVLDELAGYYLRRRSGDLYRLIAAVIYRRADEIEAVGANTLREYYMALDERTDPTSSYTYPGLGR
jgi:hypothetical protein